MDQILKGLSSDSVQLDSSAAEQERFVCDDELNERLVMLHRLARLGYGRNIQAHIDTHLPAVAYLKCVSDTSKAVCSFARRMVLCITDAPQEGTLPDLGLLIRAVMLGFRASGAKGCKSAAAQREGGGYYWSDFPYIVADDCYVTRMLLQALPCIKRPNGKERESCKGHQVALKVLMGMLLGLYASAVKFPPFHVRVAVYVNIHKLLTLGGGKKFCESHPMLMTMAFMEYCANVMPSYMPAEYDTLLGEQGMSTFFLSIPVAGDVFRQEVLNCLDCQNGSMTIPWDLLEKHCASVVDKHTRVCKNRTRIKRSDAGLWPRVAPDVVRAFNALPLVLPYDVHADDSAHRVLGSELAALDCTDESLSIKDQSVTIQYEQVAAMQSTLRVSQLPANILRMQLRNLKACMNVCERSALDGMVMRICVSCGLGAGSGGRSLQTRGQCRLDGGCFTVEGLQGVGQPNLVCAHCQADAIVAVNTLGRIVALRGQRFYLAPCCCTVQVYGGSGMEFQCEYGVVRKEEVECNNNKIEGIRKHVCSHQQKKQQQRPQRARCEICQTASAGATAPEVFSVIDHLTGIMRSIRLCSRHAPRPESLKMVSNWGQLMTEVVKRDKPLFTLGCR